MTSVWRRSAIRTVDFGILRPVAFGEQIQFFEDVLTCETSASPSIRVFLMGPDIWLDLEDWPPPRARQLDLHLCSDGRLTREPPGAEGADAFVYDPRRPVPTVGGATFLRGSAVAANAGPRDRRSVSLRDDVLCYTTDPLAEPIRVVGQVSADLHVSADVADTDLAVALVAIRGDREELVADGILRLRYRESLSTPRLLSQARPNGFMLPSARPHASSTAERGSDSR